MNNEAGKVTHQPDSLDMSILRIICQENIRSLEDYAKWLENNFTYQRHEGRDVWTEPKETLCRHSGDCKDFALLNMAFLRVLGYRSKIFAMARLFDSHAIFVFEKNGNYLWFDNNKLKEALASSVEEFKNYIYDTQHMYYLYEVNVTNLNQATACSGQLQE